MAARRTGAPARDARSEPLVSSSADTHQPTATIELRDEGQARRDDGMAAALEAAHPTWRSVAEAALDRLIAGGGDFTSDDIRNAVIEPFATGSALALGGLINGRFRRGEIVPVDWAQSSQPQRHGGLRSRVASDGGDMTAELFTDKRGGVG